VRIAVLSAPGGGAGELCQQLRDAFGLHSFQKAAFEIHEATAGACQSGDPSCHALHLLIAPDPPDEMALNPNGEREDQAIRQHLQNSQRAFHVICGNPDQRLRNAIFVIERMLHPLGADPASRPSTATERSSWKWSCERCSDGACEHQLFRHFIAADSTPEVDRDPR
jgi:hypothetical protein